MNSDLDKTTSAAAKESISALLDNEADDLDLRRVLKESESNSDARALWQRYHIASSVLRNESSPFSGMDISAAVRSEIELEPALTASVAPQSRVKGWMDFVAKGSIAATVAVGMLFGVQHFSGSTAPVAGIDSGDTLVDVEPFVAPDLNSAVVPAGFDTPRLHARTVSTGQPTSGVAPAPGILAVPEKASDSIVVNPQLQAQLDRLMMIHAQQVSESSDLSVMSFARLTDLHALDSSQEKLPADITETKAGE